MNDYENNIDINNRGMYIAGSLTRYYPRLFTDGICGLYHGFYGCEKSTGSDTSQA